jgi:hypothetical protein
MSRRGKNEAGFGSSDDYGSPFQKPMTERQILSERYNSLRPGDVITITSNARPSFHDVTGRRSELEDQVTIFVESLLISLNLFFFHEDLWLSVSCGPLVFFGLLVAPSFSQAGVPSRRPR